MSLLARVVNSLFERSPNRRTAATRLSAEGAAYLGAGQQSQAAKCFRAALASDPNCRDAHAGLGVLYGRQGDTERAIEHLLSATAAQDTLDRSLGLFLVRLLRQSARLEAAQKTLQRLHHQHPSDALVALQLATVLREQRHFDEALGCLEPHAGAGPYEAQVSELLAVLYRDCGMAEKALQHFERVAELRPTQPEVVSAVLFNSLYVAEERAALFRRHVSWGQRFAAAQGTPTPKQDPERPLRIGYVSADFHRSSAASFIEPLLALEDPGEYAVVCYHNSSRTDRTTAKLRAQAEAWRDINGLDDTQFIDAVRADSIDILVDLNGHTRGNRLTAFARRAAPLQVTYLGYGATTGIPAVDWRITDRWVDPEGSEAFYVERLARLPHSLWCFNPETNTPAVAPSPVARCGRVTYGSFNHVAKIAHAVLSSWAEILARMPDSRLLLVGIPAGRARNRILSAFTAHGIAQERIALHDRVPLPKFYALHEEVDIALDTFPYCGGATTCNALWQGVPVISLAGQGFMARSGLSLLATAGMTEWTAATPAEYVEKAVAFGRDKQRLITLRSELRGRMRHSQLCDTASFISALRQLFRQMWRESFA